MAEMQERLKQRLQEGAQGIKNLTEQSDYSEGKLTRTIESQTAKIPSVAYLNLAIGSMVFSGVLALFAERKALGNFVGLWAPTFLLLGIYNKLVKIEGSDRYDEAHRKAA